MGAPAQIIPMRVFLKIAAIFIILAVVGFGAYMLYRSFSASPEAMAPKARAPGAAAATPAAPAVKAISQREVFDYWIDRKTNAIYIVAPEGNMFRTFGDGREEEVSKQPLPGLHRITTAPDGSRMIAHFNYPAADTFALFDTASRGWLRLPEGTLAATFDASGQSVAYLRRVNGRTALYTLSLANNKTAELVSFAVSDGELRWLSDTIQIIPPPTRDIRTRALSFSISKKTLSSFDAGTMSLADVLSGNGLRFYAANGGGTLFLANAALTYDSVRLPFFSLPSKCAFADGVLYCAVPKTFPARAALPDDYLKAKFFTQDSLVAYVTATGEIKTILGSASGIFDAEHLSVRGKQLLFKNRYDERLYAVELK